MSENQNLPATLESIRQLPLPGSVYGNNIKGDIARGIEALRSLPDVTSAEDKEKLNTFIAGANKLVKIAGEKRLGITRLFDEAKKLYMQDEAEVLADLLAEVKTAVANVTKFDRAQLEKRREAERIAREDAEKEERRKRSAAGVAKVEVKLQETLEVIKEDTSLKGATIVWKYEVTGAGLVPREFCEPSDARIAAAIKQGVRTIPGVRIYEDVKRTGK